LVIGGTNELASAKRRAAASAAIHAVAKGAVAFEQEFAGQAALPRSWRGGWASLLRRGDGGEAKEKDHQPRQCAHSFHLTAE
jgi:hypothetical protein